MMVWVFMALGRVAGWCAPWVWSFGLTLQALRFNFYALSFNLNLLGAMVYAVWFRVKGSAFGGEEDSDRTMLWVLMALGCFDAQYESCVWCTGLGI